MLRPCIQCLHLSLGLLVLAALAIASPARAAADYHYLTLHNPDPTASTYFTVAQGISGGNIVGWYVYLDPQFINCGFVYNVTTRTYFTFSDPTELYCTYACGIDGANVVGYINPSFGSGNNHGFLYNLATQTYTNFDVPGASGTMAYGISGGNIVGYYYDGNGTAHGFLYNLANKTYATLDDPNAATDPDVDPGFPIGTIATGIANGIITGYYVDDNGTAHGFLYNQAAKSYTTLDAPGATASGTSGHPIAHDWPYGAPDDPVMSGRGGTFINGISGSSLVGCYVGVDGVVHGFLYNLAAKTYIVLDYPSANPQDGGTVVTGIDNSTITGAFQLPNENIGGDGAQGFFYNITTQVTATIYIPDNYQYTTVNGISGGNIVGYYYDYFESPASSFVYSLANQTATLINDPNSTASAYGTFVCGISGGNVVGYYDDAEELVHGFICNLTTQNYTTLDVTGVDGVNGTYAISLSGGNIVGYYYDANMTAHGFIYDRTAKTYTTFDDPDAGTTTDSDPNSEFYDLLGTFPAGIDGSNIVGYYIDNGETMHGFLYNLLTRTFTPLVSPTGGSCFISGISGDNVVGSFGYSQGFVYNLSTKTYRILSDPDADELTFATGISGGNVIGYYYDVNASQIGFIATTGALPGVAPSIVQLSQQPANGTLSVGASASFTVSAAGLPPLKYQWYLNGKKIPGAAKSTYTIAKTTAASVGNYTVTVSNASGSTPSAPLALVVNTLPKITTQPKALTLNYLANGNLTVAATGFPPPNYLWHQNNALITAGNVVGATGPILQFTAATPANAGNYTVTVSNNNGSVTSTIAKVTVKVPKP